MWKELCNNCVKKLYLYHSPRTDSFHWLGSTIIVHTRPDSFYLFIDKHFLRKIRKFETSSRIQHTCWQKKYLHAFFQCLHVWSLQYFPCSASLASPVHKSQITATISARMERPWLLLGKYLSCIRKDTNTLAIRTCQTADSLLGPMGNPPPPKKKMIQARTRASPVDKHDQMVILSCLYHVKNVSIYIYIYISLKYS